MSDHKKIFTEFSPSTADAWLNQAVKDLKGESFDDKLTYISQDGIKIKPFYTAEDLAKYQTLAPLFNHSDWDICEEIEVAKESAANKKALHALNNGATALLFFVFNNVDLTTLLDKIEIQYIGVHFVVEGQIDVFIANFKNYLQKNKIDISILNSSVNIDPIENLLRTGNWRKNKTEDAKEFSSLFSATAPLKTININSNIYHNAGATEAYEIACSLAHANTYINWLIDNGTDVKQLSNRFQLNVAIGPNYFFEIAKLRAYRKVFTQLLNEYDINKEIYIHAETAFRNLTVADAYNNLLRTTTEAMAASIGGCNSLVVKPFNSTYEKSTEFSDRLARNTQLILKSESYFDKIADASAGSYFIEDLTEQLAEKAWNYFTDIEKNGGLISALEKGIIQQTIKKSAQKQQADFDEGKTILVGTNKFPNAKENISVLENKIVWGNSNTVGNIIEPLTTLRLSAKAEHERIEQEKVKN